MIESQEGHDDQPIRTSWHAFLLNAIHHTQQVNDWFERHSKSSPTLPPGLFGAWIVFTCIAVGGAVFFGASIAARQSDWELMRGGAWVLASTALSWFILGPGVWLLFRRRLLTVAHLCMVTMVWGILPLFVGGCVNFALAAAEVSSPDAALVAWAAVVVSNLAMAYVFVIQWRVIGVSPLAALIAWIILLDVSGAIFFLVFYRLLLGGGAS